MSLLLYVYVLLTVLLLLVERSLAVRNCAVEPDIDGHVKIPESWTRIPVRSFAFCDTLKSITFHEGLVSIDESAFQTCNNLVRLDFPLSLVSIGRGSFAGAGLKELTIPDNVKSLGRGAFAWTRALESVSIGRGVTELGHTQFKGCTKLQNVQLPDTLVSIGREVFSGCVSLESMTIPNSVRTIGNQAFYMSSSLENITLGSSLQSISENAFFSCTKLTSLVIPDSVKTIGIRAFAKCSGLVSLYIPTTVSVGNVAFEGCLKLDICPSDVKLNIDDNGKFVVPSTWTDIQAYTFAGCNSMRSIEIPNTIITIQYAAFWKSNLEGEIQIPASVTSIGDLVFQQSKMLTTIVIPDSVVTLGTSSFSYTSLSSVVFGSGLRSIGSYAFYACGNLAAVDIPNTINIGGSAFNACPSLLTCPKVLMEEIETFNGIYRVPDDWTHIPAFKFYGCAGLRSVILPSSITSIQHKAFAYSALENVTIPHTVTSVGTYSFAYADALIDVKLSSSLRTIADSSFRSCALSEVTIPPLVRTIDQYAFADNVALVNITADSSGSGSGDLPSQLQEIGDYAFVNCWSVEAMVLPNTVVNVGISSFQNCRSMASVTIGEKVSNIKSNAFKACVNLEMVIIKPPKLDFDATVFADCNNLEANANLVISKNATSITGLPSEMVRFQCSSNKCTCKAGYGSELSVDPLLSSEDLFNCVACPIGYTSLSSQEACQPCIRGTYAENVASPLCTECSKGHYGSVRGASSKDICKPCAIGTYMPAKGAYKCDACTPGGFCNATALAEPLPSPPGHFTDDYGATVATPCPVGRYQGKVGQVKCTVCPKGHYVSMTGARYVSQCRPCEKGSFAGQSGMSACSSCTSGQYQDTEGQTECHVCSGTGQTSNADHTGCMEDPAYAALAVPSISEVLFKKGGALVGAFTVTMLFLAVVGAMQYKKYGYNKLMVNVGGGGGGDNSAKKEVGELGILAVMLKASLTGFSFGSELFLIIGLLEDAHGGRGLAATMIAFRLSHVLVAGMFIVMLFGSSGVPEWLQDKGVVKKATALPSLLCDGFCRANMPLLSSVMLLSLLDCSMVQFLPWKATHVYDESKGFPSLSLLRWCLGTDTLQATVSVLCQIIFLTSTSSTEGEGNRTLQAKALFTMNITFAVMGFVAGILNLCLKDSLLAKLELEGGDNRPVDGVGHAAIEFTPAHKNTSFDGAEMTYNSNPLHSSSSSSSAVSKGCGDDAANGTAAVRDKIQLILDDVCSDEGLPTEELVKRLQALLNDDVDGDDDGGGRGSSLGVLQHHRAAALLRQRASTGLRHKSTTQIVAEIQFESGIGGREIEDHAL
jgi:hypothetical protein